MGIAAMERAESHPSVHKKLRKMALENAAEINCSRCPYHRVENASGGPRRSWKANKAKRQWGRRR